jgi:putative ABC transport system substrate-binding protein
MRRRDFITLLGGAAAAWPLAARAQQTNKPFQIGFMPLGLPTNASDQLFVEAFRTGLQDVGLIENRDVTIDVTWVANESDYSRAVSQLLQRGSDASCNRRFDRNSRGAAPYFDYPDNICARR